MTAWSWDRRVARAARKLDRQRPTVSDATAVADAWSDADAVTDDERRRVQPDVDRITRMVAAGAERSTTELATPAAVGDDGSITRLLDDADVAAVDRLRRWAQAETSGVIVTRRLDGDPGGLAAVFLLERRQNTQLRSLIDATLQLLDDADKTPSAVWKVRRERVVSEWRNRRR